MILLIQIIILVVILILILRPIIVLMPICTNFCDITAHITCACVYNLFVEVSVTGGSGVCERANQLQYSMNMTELDGIAIEEDMARDNNVDLTGGSSNHPARSMLLSRAISSYLRAMCSPSIRHIHIPGVENTVADWLSRVHPKTLSLPVTLASTMKLYTQAQEKYAEITQKLYRLASALLLLSALV